MAGRIILASASPRRQALLAVLGLAFEVYAANIDEDRYIHTSDAGETVLRTALAKAETIAAQRYGTIIAADTTVVLDGRQLAKPATAAEAREMLLALRGRVHSVATGLVVMQNSATSGSTRMYSAMIASAVVMRDYSDAEIDAYIASGDPFDKAGAYAIQHQGFAPVAYVDGCPLNVIGLSLCALRKLLRNVDIASRTPVAYCEAAFSGCCLESGSDCQSSDRRLRSVEL